MGDTLLGFNVLLILGAVLLLASIIVFLVRKENPTFPIILALGGIFLCAAQSVRASLPGGVSVEFQRAVSDAAEKNGDLATQQEAAIQALSAQVATLQGSFTAYQTAVNDRFDKLSTAPVPVPDKDKLAQSSAAVQEQLKLIGRSKSAAVQANMNLSRFAQKLQ